MTGMNWDICFSQDARCHTRIHLIFRLQDRYVYINLIFIFPLGNVSQPKVAIGYKIQKLLLYPSALPLVQDILQTKLKNVAGSYHCDAYSIIPFSLNTS